MGMTLVTPPTAEPVSLDEALLYCRIDTTEDTAVVQRCVKSAREYIEAETGRQLMRATRCQTFPEFPGDSIELRYAPLATVTSVKYYDTAGTLQTVSASDYLVVTDIEPGVVSRKSAAAWPSTYERLDAVQVTYTCGYATATDVPAELKQCLLAIAAMLYRSREVDVAALQTANTSFEINYVLKALWHWRCGDIV